MSSLVILGHFVVELFCCPVRWLVFIEYCCVLSVWIVGFIIIEGRRWGMGRVFFIGLGMSRLYFSRGTFLCYGPGIVIGL